MNYMMPLPVAPLRDADGYTIAQPMVDFCIPSEVSGYMVAEFTRCTEPDDTPAALFHGPFAGHLAKQKAHAFGVRHIAPYGNHWTVIPLASIAMYQRLDKLRDIVNDHERIDHGEEWDARRVAAYFDGYSDIPGRITEPEAQRLIDALVKEQVLVQLGRRKAWAANPRVEH
ncbi:hypothetical protein [Nonomuraea sp. SYSU D8015]|uniref:hypothetical protein n=1 Tax=Nonomuraea sp. SYSU D8015 TaxID=2593644 RepID=UPI001660EA8E|nr:hypothetical protein [Nonomuraea sp. SYSU D8015]